MANYCEYCMRILGRPEDVKDFIDVVKNKHELRSFPYPRIFNEDIYDFDSDPNDSGLVIIGICGGCAWSVFSVMIDKQDDALSITTLQEESENLHLDIEVWSEEVGIGFQEHYYYHNGEEIINDEHSVRVYTFDDYVEDEGSIEKQFEQWKKDYELPQSVRLEDLDENRDYRIGGFDNYGEFIF